MDLTSHPTPGHSPATAPWPEGVIARYLTVGGATVDVSGGGDRTYRRCTGCGDGAGLWWSESIAHDRAQAHAETCRALPKPDGGQ